MKLSHAALMLHQNGRIITEWCQKSNQSLYLDVNMDGVNLLCERLRPQTMQGDSIPMNDLFADHVRYYRTSSLMMI